LVIDQDIKGRWRTTF